MPADRRQTGAEAEDRAATLLQDRGYRILERNYRGGRGEIDLVAEEGDVLVFVEVRARRRADYVDALSTVDAGKQRLLIRTARFYLRERQREYDPIRFDVVAFDGTDLEQVRLIRNAFEIEDPWR